MPWSTRSTTGALGELGHDELTAQLQAARALAARLEWFSLRVVREVDTRGSHVLDAALSPAAWLRHRARMSPGEAKAAVRTARALAEESLAATSAALAGGEIDPAHARLIAAHAADAPAGAVALIEPEALEVARAADPSAVAGVMRQFAHALDPDGADEAAVRRYERRGVSLATTLDGMVVGTVLLDPVAGATVLTALSAASAPVLGGHPLRVPAHRRRADRHLPAAPRHRAEDRKSGGGHPHLIVTVDADSLASEPGSRGWLAGGDARLGRADQRQHRPARQLRRRRHRRRGRRSGRRLGGRAVPAVLHHRPAGRDDRPRRRPLRGALLRPARAVVRRAPPAGAGPPAGPPSSTTAHSPAPRTTPCSTKATGPCTATDDGRYLITHPDGRTIGPEPHPPGHSRPPPQRE